MDSPQYVVKVSVFKFAGFCFKPYYKWIVLNTASDKYVHYLLEYSFKPYYKWIVLNTSYVSTEK